MSRAWRDLSRPEIPANTLYWRNAAGQLFAVEAQSKYLSAEQWRQAYSRRVLAQIEALLLQHLHTILPQSAPDKALHYLHKQ